MKTSLAIRLVLSLAVAGAAAAAHAQYVWLDEHGVKQFSDQPPPSSVPQKSILKEPGKSAKYMPPADSDGAGSGEDGDKAPKTLEDRNADFIKRHKEQAEQDAKAAEKAKQEAAKAKNCERARQYQNALASGERMATPGENGERAYMSDEQRARAMNETRQILQDCQ